MEVMIPSRDLVPQSLQKAPTPALPRAAGEGTFRVLTVVARALDEHELPDIADAWALADGLAAVEVPAEVRFARPPTIEQVRAEIEAGWDILHFDGHGTAKNGGMLVFETPDGVRDLMRADEFIEMLRQARQPRRLLILSACESAQGAGDGLAGRIAREADVPAVIGFRESVTVEATLAFVKKLYAALGAGHTIREAFESARSALRDTPNPRSRTPTMDLPVLVGDGQGARVCPRGLPRGRVQIEREPLVGVPPPSESGRFYGDFVAGDPPEGRKGLLVQTARAIVRGAKFVVLTGVGGIGKSALAAAGARKLAWRFPGGVFWVNGAAFIESGLRLDDALEPFVFVFGPEFLKATTAQKRAAAMMYLERMEAPALWVVDNADAADERVWEMARQMPGRSAALLTTRTTPEYGGCVLSVEGMAPNEGFGFLRAEIGRRKNQPWW
jgi:hypothetical protein